MTREEYCLLPEGPPHHELIRGELIPTTRPSENHRQIAVALIGLWYAQARPHFGGRLLPAPNLYLLGVEDVYHPDLAYVSPANQGISRSRGIHGVPDVICEILSPATERLDRYTKLKAYWKAGVSSVWLIDPEPPVAVQEFVMCHDGTYRLNANLSAPADWEPFAFPGWRISLAELNAAATLTEDEGE